VLCSIKICIFYLIHKFDVRPKAYYMTREMHLEPNPSTLGFILYMHCLTHMFLDLIKPWVETGQIHMFVIRNILFNSKSIDLHVDFKGMKHTYRLESCIWRLNHVNFKYILINASKTMWLSSWNRCSILTIYFRSSNGTLILIYLHWIFLLTFDVNYSFFKYFDLNIKFYS